MVYVLLEMAVKFIFHWEDLDLTLMKIEQRFEKKNSRGRKDGGCFEATQILQ